MKIKSLLVLWKRLAKHLLLSSFLLLFFSAVTVAQQRTVTGTVTSSTDGLSLPGVNVVVQGTSTGTILAFHSSGDPANGRSVPDQKRPVYSDRQ